DARKALSTARLAARKYLNLCSTPLGIIGIHTLTAVVEDNRIVVLNAFRHHRNSHVQLAAVRGDAFQSAQRLSASLEFTRYEEGSERPTGIRCSTPFGIIGIHTSDR